MYSVVLLMAVTSGGEAAEFGRRGCSGCAASCRGGCYVSSGCAARSRGCDRPARGRRAKCGGCAVYASGCYGSGYAGCYASYSGCVAYSGAATYPACTGGKVVYGQAGAGGVVYSGVVIGGEVATAESDEMRPGTALSPSEQTMLREMMDAEKNATERAKIEEEFKKDSRAGRKATYEVFKKRQSNKDETTAMIVVTVPETATVKIDGENTLSTSTIRRFESPALAKGQTYSYTFVAEYQDNGQPVTVQKKVSFQAGKVVRLDLTNGATAVASK